jgi:ATP-binding cassette subfamily B protein
LHGIDTLLALNAAYVFTELNKQHYVRYQDNIVKLRYALARLSFIADLFAALLTVGVLTYGALHVVKGQLMLGKMMAGYSLIINVLPGINRMILAATTFQGAQMAAKRLRDVLMIKPEQSVGRLPFVMHNSLVLRRCRFGWPKESLLLNDVTIEIPRGRLTALKGRSGTGKTTLVQILQRKYPLAGGCLFVDDISADRIDLGEYRRYVAVVPQQVDIFNGTLAENILLGRTFAGLTEMCERIESLGFALFVSRFSSGLLTHIGEDGCKLSGGELQMLALIRALYESPDVLILDEGLNAVDCDVEQLIWKIIRDYARQKAVLLITHNRRILAQTDYLYQMHKGTICSAGRPDELLSVDSIEKDGVSNA